MAESIEDTARRMVEGIWYLEEWHLGDEVFRPPQAVGRTIFLAGTVSMLMTIEAGEREIHRYGMGRIAFEGDRMRYGYDQLFDFIRGGDTFSGASRARAGRLTSYQMRLEQDRLIAASETLGIRFVFGPERLETYDGEKLTRVWRRRVQET